MKGFDVLKVKSAVKSHNKFDLSHTHLTTMDFGQIVPLFAEETVPGDKFSVSAEFFSRMAPLVKPTYGKFAFKTVAGFVPYHQIADDADAWLAGKTTWEGQTPKHRYFTLNQLATFLIDYCIESTDASTAAEADFYYTKSDGTNHLAKLTNKGKYYVKILNSLGYAIPQGINFQSSSAWNSQVSQTKLSAYPLLAFAKLYNDYMSQSQRYNTSILSSFLHNVKRNNNISNQYNSNLGAILSGGINVIMSNILLCYENDYFTSAWQNANAPLGTSENITGVVVPEAGSVSTLSSDVSRVYANVPTNGSSASFSQRALDFLKSFDDWVRRNNYSGSRAVQQVYSRFGIKTDDYRSNYADVIGTDFMPIQVGDITATADAENVPLGDYAGKGIMNGSKGFSYNCTDYGMLFILGYFTVSPMMSYGFDRTVLRNAPLDYYNPEFDGLGAEAISLGEVFENPKANGQDTTKTTDVFGYTERYNSYRYGRDQITGDFRKFNNDADMNTWHSGRLLGTVREQGQLVAQSSTMNTLPQTDSEYNRIFSTTDGKEDHFYMTAKFVVSAIRPMMNLNQVVRLGEGDTAVPRNGNVIS